MGHATTDSSRTRGRLRASSSLALVVGVLLLALAGWGLASARSALAKDTAPAGKHPPAEKEEGAGHAAHGAEEAHAVHEPSALDHVMDTYDWHLFMTFAPTHIPLPHTTVHIGDKEVTIGLSKFMILQVIAAGLVALFYIPMGRRLQNGEVPRGWSINVREVLLTFVRDNIAKPNIGEHDADKFVPFLWTLFLFILFNNLLGMVPLFGSATGSIFVTLGLAIVVFFAIHGSAIAKMGFGPYLLSMWPHIDVPIPGAGFIIKLFVFLIEIMGVLVRNLVLAVRLFANMFAGHMVLATILIFIWAARNTNPALWATITLSSVVGQVALSLLELFVAFLQAFIFVFLASLFMGMALHPEH
jgi:F-type H+-transporting ATPase subunit a